MTILWIAQNVGTCIKNYKCGRTFKTVSYEKKKSLQKNTIFSMSYNQSKIHVTYRFQFPVSQNVGQVTAIYTVSEKNNGGVSGGSVSRRTKGIALNVVTSHSSTQTVSREATSKTEAPPHSSRHVMEFPGRWIGRGSSILWPPRSPDLIQFGFFCFEAM
jgi:hypothetical protein